MLQSGPQTADIFGGENDYNLLLHPKPNTLLKISRGIAPLSTSLRT